MKGELEDGVRELAFQYVSIFQPSLLLGERSKSRFGEDLASVFLPSLCKLPGLKKYRPIRGTQVALKMVQTFSRPTPGHKVFNLDEVFPD
jgi:hypothetical protein